MNLIRDIARRNARFAKRSPARRSKYAVSLGDHLGMAGGAITASDPRRMAATFVISTQEEDYEGDVLISRGCRVENYRANPVVLFDHNLEKTIPPIGLAEEGGRLLLDIRGKEIESTCIFHGKTQLSNEMFELVDARIVRGASVGFMPIPGKYRKNGTRGHVFDEWDLTEWSITPVGMNPGALRLHLDAGRVKSLGLRSQLERFAAKAKTNWSRGVKMAKEDEDKDDLDLEEEATVDDAADLNPDDDEDKSLDAEDMDDATDDDLLDDEPAEDMSQKPGARALGELSAAFDVVYQRVAELISGNDHPEIVSALEKLKADCETVKTDLSEAMTKVYPGLDPDTVKPIEPEPEDEALTKAKTLFAGLDAKARARALAALEKLSTPAKPELDEGDLKALKALEARAKRLVKV